MQLRNSASKYYVKKWLNKLIRQEPEPHHVVAAPGENFHADPATTTAPTPPYHKAE
jgi:hypothetical protein